MWRSCSCRGVAARMMPGRRFLLLLRLGASALFGAAAARCAPWSASGTWCCASEFVPRHGAWATGRERGGGKHEEGLCDGRARAAAAPSSLAAASPPPPSSGVRRASSFQSKALCYERWSSRQSHGVCQHHGHSGRRGHFVLMLSALSPDSQRSKAARR